MMKRIVGVVVVLGLLGCGVYFYIATHGGGKLPMFGIANTGPFKKNWTRPAPSATPPMPPVGPLSDPVPQREVPVGQKEYKTDRFHLSILYPQDLTVEESVDKYGSLTVVLQNPDKNAPKGFQVYVQPYTLPQVTDERFKKDLPSGVRTNVSAVVIDGATGAAFYSKDDRLGDTREVWFIHDGLLYEATTPKPLEAWFRDILATWKFI